MAGGGKLAATARRTCAAAAAVAAALGSTSCDREPDAARTAVRPVPYRAAIAIAEPSPIELDGVLRRTPALGQGLEAKPHIAVTPRKPAGIAASIKPKKLAGSATSEVASSELVAATLSSQPSPNAGNETAALAAARSAEAPSAFVGIEAQAPPAAIAAAVPVESPAYVSQISDEVRAAYIAQVEVAAPAQRLAVRSGGTLLGAVEFQVADGQVSVKIGQVLDLFEGGMETVRFAQLRESQAAQEFVSLDRLQAAGIPLEYNAAYDELTLDPVRG